MADIELARNCDEAIAFGFEFIEVKETCRRRVLSFDDDEDDFCFSELKFQKLDISDDEDESDLDSSLSFADSDVSSSASPSSHLSPDDFLDVSAPLLHVDEIQQALEPTDDTPRELVADFSQPYSLPTVQGRHGDLTAISPTTLASLLAVQTHDRPEVTVVDCRYPYEFSGGHIRGAKNLFTQDMVREEFLAGRSALPDVLAADQRHIVVFHCEFSIERGPGLLRFLREQDRALNGASYPALHHPEVYILEGGYRAFYDHCQTTGRAEELCDGGYRLMVDEEYGEHLKFYRRETKTSKKRTSGRIPRNKMGARSKSRLFT